MIRIGLLGARGRMGSQVSRLLVEEFPSRATLAAAIDQGQPPSTLLECDAVIDFSSPTAMAALAREALERSGPLPVFAVGSTGWRIDEKRAIEELAARTPVLLSSNFSVGVLALLELLKEAGPLLSRLGYKPVIVERHHAHKKDAPSGTALALQRVISPQGPGNVPIHSVRAGEVIGDHEAAFYGTADVLSFSHHAQDRSIFARGALQASLWLHANRATLAERRKLIGMSDYFHHLKESTHV